MACRSPWSKASIPAKTARPTITAERTKRRSCCWPMSQVLPVKKPVLQKADAPKSRCLERPVPRKADSNPRPQGPQAPWGPTGPTPWFPDAFPLFGRYSVPAMRRSRSLRSSRSNWLQPCTSSAETESKGESREEGPTRTNADRDKFQRGQIKHPRRWCHRARVVAWDSNSGSHGGRLPEVSLSQASSRRKMLPGRAGGLVFLPALPTGTTKIKTGAASVASIFPPLQPH